MLEARGQGVFLGVGQSELRDGGTLEFASIAFDGEPFKVYRNRDVADAEWEAVSKLAVGAPCAIRGALRQDGQGKTKFRLLSIGTLSKAA